MKFLVLSEPNLKEHFDALANGLMANGQEVFGFTTNIYRAYEEQGPDYFIFGESSLKHPEIQHFLNNKRPNFLVLKGNEILLSSGISINLPSFASTLKYKPELFSKELECDIAIFFDGNSPDTIHAWYNRFYRNYSVKILGAFINCMGYIGVGSPVDVVKLGKSAKLTLCNNQVVANSLAYNNILVSDNANDVVALLERKVDDIEETILHRKKNIISEIKLGKLICEKLSDSN